MKNIKRFRIHFTETLNGWQIDADEENYDGVLYDTRDRAINRLNETLHALAADGREVPTLAVENEDGTLWYETSEAVPINQPSSLDVPGSNEVLSDEVTERVDPGGIDHITLSDQIGRAEGIEGERTDDSQTLEALAIPLSLDIDPGTASPEQIADLLTEMSTLYRMIGGSGLTFTLAGVSVAQVAQ